MKKLIVSLAIGVCLSLSAFAGSQTWNILNGNCSNLLSGPVKITQVILISTNNNTTQIAAIDSPSTTLTNIVGSFSQITFKGTNWINNYTDFFGNSILTTNFALIHETNTIAGQTNFYPTRFTLAAGTNAQTFVDNTSYFFTQGFTVTNTGAGMATVVVKYQQ